ALIVDEPGYVAARFPRFAFGEHRSQKARRFDIAAPPADVGHGDDPYPVGLALVQSGGVHAPYGHDETGMLAVGNGMVAAMCTARHLHVEDAELHAVAPQRFVHDR